MSVKNQTYWLDVALGYDLLIDCLQYLFVNPFGLGFASDGILHFGLQLG